MRGCFHFSFSFFLKKWFADATQWTIRKEVAGDFFIYLHDRGSGFVKNFGERMSVFGRYITTGDKTNPVSTVQFGAAKSY